MVPSVTFHGGPSSGRSAHDGSTNAVGLAVVATVVPALVVIGSGDDEMAAVELVLDVAGANSDVLPPPHTQHATDAVVSLEPVALAKSVLHSWRNRNDVHVYTLFPNERLQPTGKSTHDGSTNTVGAGVVVALEGMSVVKLLSGSGDDEMAAVELELDVAGANSDVLPPPHIQHATDAVVSLDPTASAKSVLHNPREPNREQVYVMLPRVRLHCSPPTGRSEHDGSTNTVGAGVVVTLVGDGVVMLVSGSGDDEIPAVDVLEVVSFDTMVGASVGESVVPTGGATEGATVGATVGGIVGNTVGGS